MIEVVLVLARPLSTDPDYWYVVLRGIPGMTDDGYYEPRSLPRQEAEQLKEQIENALRAYPHSPYSLPKPQNGRSAWERLGDDEDPV